MPTIRLPNNWNPRPYQRAAWDYLENGGKHAELVFHRRAGKDDVVLHRTAIAAFERVANYWHMLPLATQVRKAIWTAVNPHTGLRRIDEAFPHELRSNTNDTEMMIRFKNGSTWQALGSDNFQASIGSTPAGIVYSEWAQSNPSAKAYLRPILLENNGWQVFITTPRGKNHAYKTFKAAQQNPKAFAQLLTVEQTGVFTPEQMAEELKSLVDEYGPDTGNALFRQEYYCSFDAAIMGAFYGEAMAKLEQAGRLELNALYDPLLPVHTAWDLGRTDDTAIWFYQEHHGELRFIDYYAMNGKEVDHYAEIVLGRKVIVQERDLSTGWPTKVKLGERINHRADWKYGEHWLPHDAKPKTLASGGRSILEQLWSFGVMGKIAPALSLEDGIQATRNMLQRAYFDAKCDEGVEALKQYQREWDDEKRCFRDKPLHNFASHPADAARTAACSWRLAREEKVLKVDLTQQPTYNDYLNNSDFNGNRRARI